VAGALSPDGLIQNGLSRSLISQSFLPKGDTDRRFRRTLRNKRFSGASDTTADQRARLSWLRAARQFGLRGRSLPRSSPFPVSWQISSNGKRRHGASPAYLGKRAALLRLARHVARDQQTRTPPSISLPRLRCLEEGCDTTHGAPPRALRIVDARPASGRDGRSEARHRSRRLSAVSVLRRLALMLTPSLLSDAPGAASSSRQPRRRNGCGLWPMARTRTARRRTATRRRARPWRRSRKLTAEVLRIFRGQGGPEPSVRSYRLVDPQVT